MSTQKDDWGWFGWFVAAVIGIIFGMYFFGSNNKQDDGSWHCVDATSYDRNAYNDNKCTNGPDERYVSDSEAVQLDSSYSPGKAGAAYYNNQ